MDLSNLTIFRLAKKRLDWSAQREQVLAANIANANSPGYRAKDIESFDFKTLMRQEARKANEVKPMLTHPMHSRGTIPERGPYQVAGERKAFEVAPDGNTVVLEDQAMKMADAKGQYDLAINLFHKNLQLLRMAIGKRGD